MLSFNDVSKIYSSSNTKAIINLNLNFKEGEFVCLLGPNGAGKTTFLKLLSKELTPTKGSIEFNGVNLLNMNIKEWRNKIGEINQSPIAGLAPGLTVRENLLLSYYKGKSLKVFSSVYSSIVHNNLLSAIDYLQLDIDLDYSQVVRSLSGGQKQLLSILMLYLQSPEILMMDEPTASLDHRNEKLFLNNLIKWTKNMNSISFLVTHNIETALSINARIIFINNGVLVHDFNINKSKEYIYNKIMNHLI